MLRDEDESGRIVVSNPIGTGCAVFLATDPEFKNVFVRLAEGFEVEFYQSADQQCWAKQATEVTLTGRSGKTKAIFVRCLMLFG